MPKYFILLFISLFLMVNNFAFAQKISKSDLIYDLNFLQTAFANGHPVNAVKKVDLTPIIQTLAREMPDSLTHREFENSIRKALFAVGCVHTSIDAWTKGSSKLKPKFLPFHGFTDGEKLFYFATANDSLLSPLRKGDEILAINGHSAQSILDILRVYHAVDGSSFDFNYVFINKNLPKLYYKCIERAENFEITFKNEEGSVQKCNIGAFYTIKDLIEPENTEKAVFEAKQKAFFIKNDTIGVIKTNSFKANDIAFYSKVFDFIAKNKIKRLVIDVRNNLGGDRASAKTLLSYLVHQDCRYSFIRPKQNLLPYLSGGAKVQFLFSYLYYGVGYIFQYQKTKEDLSVAVQIKPKKQQNFKGKLIVLANGFTSSSGSLTAAFLQEYANATVIGQTTGGGRYCNNGGSFPTLTLPKSSIKINLATYFIDYNMKTKNLQGIKPDVPIRYSVQDFMSKDLEMEAALR